MSALNDVASMGRRVAAGELSVVILVLFCVKSGGAAIRLENEPPLNPERCFVSGAWPLRLGVTHTSSQRSGQDLALQLL